MNFNCPVAETSESIEPNDNNLELNTIAYTFSKIDSNLNFNTSPSTRVPSAIANSLPSLQRRTGKLKKKEHFRCCGRFHSLAVAFSNTKTRREDEKDQIDNETRLFWKSIVKKKKIKASLGLASYADVLRLVTRSSPRTSAQRTGHIRSLAVSQS